MNTDAHAAAKAEQCCQCTERNRENKADVPASTVVLSNGAETQSTEGAFDARSTLCEHTVSQRDALHHSRVT